MRRYFDEMAGKFGRQYVPGRSWKGVAEALLKLLDHDLEPELKLTPFGLHRPDTAETWLSFTTGSATADFMVDRLSEIWPTLKKTVIVHIPSS